MHAAIDDQAYSIETLLEWFDATSDGAATCPIRPNYPKMPGEPKRVQPSKARDDAE